MTNEQEEMREYVLNLIEIDILEFEELVNDQNPKRAAEAVDKMIKTRQRHRSEFLKMCEQNETNTKK